MLDALDLGDTDADGAQDTVVGADADLLDAERSGNGAGVLPTGAAETAEHVIVNVIALGDRDSFDRGGHVGIGDSPKPIRQFDVRKIGAAAGNDLRS